MSDQSGSPEGPVAPDLEQQKAQIEAEMAEESGALHAEIERRKAAESGWVPESGRLDRHWQRHELNVDAALPADEANQAARAAGNVASLADEDRAAVDAAPGATRQQRDEVGRLADDAIDAGMRVTQDALDAQAAHAAGDPEGSKAARDRAEQDLERASADLSEADRLRNEAAPPGS